MKDKIIFIGLEYALDNYFSNHYAVLSNYEVVKYRIDMDAPTSWIYKRRSLMTLPIEIMMVFFYLLMNRPKYIISVGPKVGLLSSICSRVLFIENIHWFTGQVWAKNEKKGLSFYSDLIISKLSSHICADSHGQAGFIEKNLNILKGSIRVPIDGSINGLSDKYFINQIPNSEGNSNRLIFIGRITEDKGVFCLLELARKFIENSDRFVVEFYGQMDQYFHRKTEFLEQVSKLENVHYYEGFANPIQILPNAFLLVLPSHREGFGSILIEAQSQGVPVLCSDIYGVSDSLIPGETGFICPVDDVNSFYEKVIMLETNQDLRKKMVINAIEFSNKFQSNNFRVSITNLYIQIGLKVGKP